VPFLGLSSLLRNVCLCFFFLDKIFLGSGKKKFKAKFLFFSFCLEKQKEATHLGQPNSFFDNSAVLRTGIFLFLLFYFSLRPTTSVP